MKRFGIMATVLTLAVVAGGAAVAQNRYHDQYDDRGDSGRHGGVTVYVDDDFRGRSMHIDGPISRLGPTGMEDRISSIGVDGGAWEVCTDDDFRGRCETIDRSIGRLSRMGLEDNISSIRPLRREHRHRY